MKKGKKIVIVGAGNVGATIAYTMAIDAAASEIVIIDINHSKAKGEAMDIIQGTPFTQVVNLYAGTYENAVDADMVILTVGIPRKPGMTRLDLAQTNVDIFKQVIPNVVKYAPEAVYLVVSNPVDILTYVVTKISGLPPEQVIGSGTMLDSARLRNSLAEHVGLNSKNVDAYVFGEHGDTSMIPWSLANIAGLKMADYCEHICHQHNSCGKIELRDIENDVRGAGAKVISYKGSTYYAVALSVRRICEIVLRNTGSVITVSSLVTGQYGIEDICLSLPFVVGARGIERQICPPLLPEEEKQLIHSAETLKEIKNSLII